MTAYKNKTRVKVDPKEGNIDELVELKFRYDMLSSELFHLGEYISLVDFDPTVKNETDSFNKFLHEEELAIDENEYNDSNSSNTKIVRRHQLRGVNTSSSGSQGLQELEPLVKDKYQQLKDSILSDNTSIKRENSIQNNIPTKKITSPMKKEQIRKALPKRKYSKVKKEEKEILVQEPKIEEVGKNIDLTIPVEEEEEDDYYFTTSSEEEMDSKAKRNIRKRARINVKFEKPKQTITNPMHVIKPQYNSLSEYLDSFKLLDEDMTADEYNHFIREQKHAIAEIKKGLKNGILKYDPETQEIQAVTTKDIKVSLSNKPDPITYIYKEQNRPIFEDYLVNQGVHMSKLFQNSRKARISRAKKVSQMIEQHFKHIAGAEERRIKEEEKQKRAITRTILQAFKKRWNLADRAYRILKKDEEEQLKRIQGKKHLSKILEQSTQLLGAQLNQGVEESETEGNGSNSDASNMSGNDSGNDDDILSSSSSESEPEVDPNSLENTTNGPPVDETLSVDELKQKYKTTDQDTLLDESENGSDTSSIVKTDSEDDDEVSHDESVDGGAPGLGDLFNIDYEKENDNNESEESGDYQMTESGSESENDEDMSDSDESITKTSNNKDEDNQDIEENTIDKTEGSLDILKSQPEQSNIIDVPVPPLLRGTLRIYQKQGLNWLASLYNNNTNGILADEMGLGKTIQTISLLAWLACEKENWGPHLIVVPTSVLLNWEMEFKRFAPGMKVLTYYGSPQQRKEKRKGWNKPDAFHVCIVSYQLIVQDQHSFKRKKWQYMVLDEAHNIKNFRSTRWQALLNFNTRRRLLLTGTPLQNNLAELWSLLYFLMPQTMVNGKKVSGFADLDAFQQWFGHPVDKIMESTGGIQDEETKKTVAKLHQVLRPYLLRRLKADVEKQMPAKYEHIVYCRLSKRQRFLYDDFMSRSKTRETLASGNFMSIVNCLMQLRKVCNHPDLFEVRPILTSFECGSSVMNNYVDLNKTISKRLHQRDYDRNVDLDNLNLIFSGNDVNLTTHNSDEVLKLKCINNFVDEIKTLRKQFENENKDDNRASISYSDAEMFFKYSTEQKVQRKIDSLEFNKYINDLRCSKSPVYGKNLMRLLTLKDKLDNDVCEPIVTPLQTRFFKDKKLIDNFAVLTPKAVTLNARTLALGLNDDSGFDESVKMDMRGNMHTMDDPFHHLQTKLTIAFPDKSLLQYDCGKLQKLAKLMQDLKDNGHRALIFTQMTKVLDILEQFLNYHGYLYMRLDGATKVEDRQILTERFNSDNKITVFILSSRSGGLGINLTGADTVIFYDSDWNPAMDKQCQDRCHRIGQTRDVHIYRFVSEHTIESNILKKANQKRQLDNVVIQEGDFTTDYFNKVSIRDLFGGDSSNQINAPDAPLLEDGSNITKNPKDLEKLLAQAEDEDDVRAANQAMKEVQIDEEDFTEDVTNPDGSVSKSKGGEDEYEGTNHVEEYMLRFIANGYYY